MATFIKIRADGVVLHRHVKANDPEGKSWHPAKEMHKDLGIHEVEDAAHPANYKELNAQQKKDYALNLTGKAPEWAVADWKVKVAAAKAKKAAAGKEEVAAPKEDFGASYDEMLAPVAEKELVTA